MQWVEITEYIYFYERFCHTISENFQYLGKFILLVFRFDLSHLSDEEMQTFNGVHVLVKVSWQPKALKTLLCHTWYMYAQTLTVFPPSYINMI